MENMEKTKKIIRVSKKGTVIFVIIAIIVGAILLGFNIFRPHNPCDFGDCGMVTGVNSVATPSFSENSKGASSDYYRMPYPQNNPTVNDTREFLKTNYNAEIQTRNVKRIVLDIKNAVRDVAGRVDSSNENPQNGYVSFVVPKSNFENFKDQIASITNEKLIIENVSSDNLLSQKQSIEQEQNSANSSLEQLLQQQNTLTSKHAQTKNKLQSELTNLQNQLAQFSMTLPPYPDPNQIAQIQSLNTNIGIIKQQIASENSSFNTSNQNLKNQIDGVNAELTNIAEQDSNFMDNIETVSGSISVRWVSLWELAKIFLPVSPVIIIIILVVILWVTFRKSSYIPKVEFV